MEKTRKRNNLLATLKGRGFLEVLDVDGRVLLKRFIKEVVCKVEDWDYVAQDGDGWRTFV